jgi:Fis family transcriptional regulator, factor for inversion stimulation protein
MFRDDAQASRAIGLLLSNAGLHAFWSEAGPSRAVLSRHEDDLPPEKRALLLAAWSLWTPIAPGIGMGEVVRSLGHAECAALCSLIIAYKGGPEAVDTWIAAAALGSPHPAGPEPAAPLHDAGAGGSKAWALPGHGPPLSGDWPTLDLLSLRYVVRVLDHARGNKTRAAEMLGVDRRTVSRLVSAARKGVTPMIQTQQRRGSRPVAKRDREV